jgi:predicted RNase H-like nuclease (RuvC/YqgF family)
MAILGDQYLTSLQQWSGIIGGIIVGSVMGALGMWRAYAKTRKDAEMAKGEWKWMEERSEMLRQTMKENAELRIALRDEERLRVRAETQLEVAKERLQDEAADLAKQIGACDERIRSLSEQVLDQKMANSRLLLALHDANPAEAQKLLESHLRPPDVTLHTKNGVNKDTP